MKVLVVVDMQNDFVFGALGSEEARAVVDNVANVIAHFEGVVVFTRDTHEANYLKTNEGRHLPVEHCIRGTEGHKIVPQLMSAVREKPCLIYDKPTFGLKNFAQRLKTDVGNVSSIELCGVCTDICVVSNALILKADYPEIPVCVRANCCAGTSEQAHQAALTVMKSCQVEII